MGFLDLHYGRTDTKMGWVSSRRAHSACPAGAITLSESSLGLASLYSWAALGTRAALAAVGRQPGRGSGGAVGGFASAAMRVERKQTMLLVQGNEKEARVRLLEKE